MAPSAILVAVLYALASAAVALWSATSLSLRQGTVPGDTLGRVNATFRLATWGMSTVGMLLSGVLVAAARPVAGEDAALRLPYLLAGVAYLLLALYLTRRLARLQLPSRDEEGTGAEDRSGHR